MEVTKTKNNNQVTQERIEESIGASLLGEFGYPDPENPQPPGPWDPIIRESFMRASLALYAIRPRDGAAGLFPYDDYYSPVPPKPNWSLVFGPMPDPWSFSTGFTSPAAGLRDLLAAVGLNPQPLPPAELFAAALVQSVVNRAEAMREIVANLGVNVAERGIIIVGGRPFSGLVDDICGNVIRKPVPIPPPWWNEAFGAAGLLVMAAQFSRASKRTLYEDLRKEFADAGRKIGERGLSELGR